MYRINEMDFSLVEGRILRHSSKRKQTIMAISIKKEKMKQADSGRKSHLLVVNKESAQYRALSC